MKIPYGKHCVLEDDIEFVVETLRSDYLTCGPKVNDFEKKIAEIHNAKYAVAFCNGTAALHAAYYALDVNVGDEIITSPITFAATANAAVYCGGKPVFSDISMDTYCLNPEAVRKMINCNTKVITPVAFAGYPVDLKTFREIANENKCKLLYDAAHGIGSMRSGDFGMQYIDAAILSFHPVKHIACGEGGMVLTNDDKIYKKLMLFRTHGIIKNVSQDNDSDGGWYYDMIDLGYNYRMSDIAASLGLSQLKRLDSNLNKRRIIAGKYDEAFKEMSEIKTPPTVYDFSDLHSFHLYVIRVENADVRRRLYDYLHLKGILVQVHYIPIYHFTYYQKKYGYVANDYPNAEEFYNTCLSLPIFHSMNDEQQEYVIESINLFFKNKNSYRK